MTEVDMLLRDTLTDRAQAAPNGAGLLTRVHTRSRLIRRRRRVGVAGAGVAAVLLGVAGVPVAKGVLPGGDGAPRNVGGPAATTTVGPEATPTPVGSGEPATPPPAVTAVLGPPTFTVPKVPFVAPTGVIDGLAPAVGLVQGTPIIMHSPDGGPGADSQPFLMLYIGANADIAGEPSSGTPVQVRGVRGTLSTPAPAQGPGPYLSWTEPDGTPMYIRASNIPADRLVAYANGLKRGNTAVPVPFSFSLLPEGLELGTVNVSDMVFKVPGQPASADYLYKLGFFLNADGGENSASWPLTVGGRRAQLVPQEDGGRMLMVSQPNGYVLSVQVPVNIKISDADLFRMTAGVTVNPSAKGGRG